MKQLESYKALCTEVYELSKPAPPLDSYAFYKSYAQEARGPILEPMCGTGRFLLPLIEEGFDVSGFDASETMLDVLRKKANQKNLNLEIRNGFIEDFKQDKKYSLIFIPTGSFGLILDDLSIKQALKSMYHHLTDRGTFVFEVETSHALPPLDVWRGSLWKKDDGTCIVLSQLATLKDNICHSICKYELIAENKIQRVEVEEFNVRLYDDIQSLIDLLKQIGFKEVKILKAFDRTQQPGKSDEAIVLECTK